MCIIAYVTESELIIYSHTHTQSNQRDDVYDEFIMHIPNGFDFNPDNIFVLQTA